MGDVLQLDETSFGRNKLVLEYEDHAELPGFRPANILRIYFCEYIGDKCFNIVNETIFPASDFPAALKEYRARASSPMPANVNNAYWHVSMFLEPEVAPTIGMN